MNTDECKCNRVGWKCVGKPGMPEWKFIFFDLHFIRAYLCSSVANFPFSLRIGFLRFDLPVMPRRCTLQWIIILTRIFTCLKEKLTCPNSLSTDLAPLKFP